MDPPVFSRPEGLAPYSLDLDSQYRKLVDTRYALNSDIEREINSSALSFERQLTLEHELRASVAPVLELYQDLVKLNPSSDLLPDWRCMIDRLEHDRNQLLDQLRSVQAADDNLLERQSVASRTSTSSRSSVAMALIEAQSRAAAARAAIAVEEEKQQVEAAIQKARANLESLTNKAAVLQHESVAKIEEAKAAVLQKGLSNTSNLFGRLNAESTMNYGRPTQLNASQLKPHDESAATLVSMHSLFQELKDTLVDSRQMAHVPPPEPTVFHGNPLEYPDWIAGFDALIDGKRHSAIEKLHYLRRYVDGQAKKAISGYFLLHSEEAYNDARVILKKRFGNPHLIARAFRDKLSNWPKIGSREGKAVQDLTDFLHQCLTAKKVIPQLAILDDYHENQQIVAKLPAHMVARWVRIVEVSQEAKGTFPDFKEFCNFMQTEASVACNPIMMSSQQFVPKRVTHVVGTKPISTYKPETLKVHSFKCLFCEKDSHSTVSCFKLAKQTKEKQNEFMKSHRLCFSCLVPNHMASQCRKRAKCDTCGKAHPTSLHRDKSTITTTVIDHSTEDVVESSENDNAQHVTSSVASEKQSGMHSLAVPVWVSTQDSTKEVLVYALLDSQSDTSFVSNSVVEELGVAQHDSVLNLTTMTTDNKAMQCKKVSGLTVRGHNSEQTLMLPQLYTRPSIPAISSHIPTYDTVKSWPHLKKIANQVSPKMDIEVALLIGYNCPQAFIPRQCITGSNDQPFAIRSDLGWMVMGSTDSDSNHALTHRIASEEISIPHDPERKSVTFRCKAAKQLESKEILDILHSDFQEQSQEASDLSMNDKLFLSKMAETIHQDREGYVTIPLPLKSPPPPNSSLSVAEHRFSLLEKKFKADPNYAAQYKTFMTQILAHGDAEIVPENELDSSDMWYIPHFGVYHPKKPNKIRVVFDCSSKVGGTCLNEYLLQGPDHINSLAGILMRFRKEPVAVMCDVERMFHQFRVTSDCRDYLRFLWYNSSGAVVPHRMKVHLFGATSSPACATYGLRYISRLSDSETVQNFINKDFYVDDGLTSLPTSQDALSLIEDVTRTCANANVRLHKFISNDFKVMEAIPVSERAETVVDLSISKQAIPTERALGVQWNVNTDSFQFRSEVNQKPNTKRAVLSTVASIFDPLGLIAPFTLKGKAIMQAMCENKAAWDDYLPPHLLEQWNKWKQTLENLTELSIPRCYKPAGFDNVQKAELHNFSDASTTGYGQCSYLRLVDSCGKVHVSLVTAKARVAPLQTVSIPRLELQAAKTSVLISKVVESQLQVENLEQVYWTDSTVVLSYISNESRRFHTYVSNRVQAIRDQTKPEQWNYVPTQDNPADHASRGMYPHELAKSNWFKGPEFLWANPVQKPPQPNTILQADDPEVKVMCKQTLKTQYSDLPMRLERFSSWKQATTAVMNIENMIRSKKKTEKLDTITAMQKAETSIIKALQESVYAEEMQTLRNSKKIRQTSSLLKLNPYLGSDSILRVGGRLQASTTLSEGEIHPIILPKSSHLTDLIVRHYHQRVAHQGKGMTLAAIRTAGYWLMSGHRVVSSMIHKCITCRKLRAKPQEQQMSQLPSDRVESAPPFSYSGCDCFGPFLAKDGRKECKRYGLLFTCLASRAVHIELLDDLTTDSFINALRRLVAIRGPMRQLRCDRGTNFVGALSELAKQLTSDHTKIQSQCQTMNIEFVFNPPSASHMGGVWERQIRTIRNVLKSVTLKHGGRFDSTTLRTILYEVMAIVNSRPLTQVTDENTVLSPNMLLTMKSDIVLPPPGNFSESDVYSKKRWRQVQHIANEFWKRWRSEYLSQLQIRQKWQHKVPNVKVGDIVLLADATLARSDWKLARIIRCISSKDNLVRTVEVQVANPQYPKRSSEHSLLIRPIHKLVVLQSSS